MEIIFNKLSYIENKNSSLERVYLDDVNFVISQGSISAFFGDDLQIIGNLLMAIKRPSKGELKIDDIVLKRTSHVENVKDLRKKIGIVSFNSLFLEDTVKEEIKRYMNNYNYHTSNITKHIVDSLKLVGLSDKYLDRDPSTLSSTEAKRLSLACVISYNPDVLILDNFDIGFTAREKDYFKKLFLKLKNKFKKTIILLMKKVSSAFDLVDKIYVISNGKLVISGGKELFYDDNLYKYLEMPKIVEFTKYVQSRGHDIQEYTDTKELLKELYRKC